MDRRSALKTLLSGTAAVTVGIPAGAQPSNTTRTANVTTGYAPRGSVDLVAAAEAVVGDAGDFAYVATIQGFAVVDIRNPARPSVVYEREEIMPDFEDGPIETIADLRFDDDRLLVGGPYNGAGLLRGFALYDVSEPINPTRILARETGNGHHNLEYEDGFAYTSRQGRTTNEMAIFDLRGDRAVERAAWDLTAADQEYADLDRSPVFIHDLWVHEQLAYLCYWDAGTFIVDVANPDDPAFVGWVPGRTPTEIREDDSKFPLTELPGNHHFATVSDDGSLLAVGLEAWDAPQTDHVGGPGGIELWDVSDPTAPTHLSTIDAPPGQGQGYDPPETTAHNCDFHGDRLYSSWYNGGVKIHDVTDPSNPEELAWWRMPEETSFWTAQYATAETFVASSTTIGGRSRRAALFTFPNEPGEQENPPRLGETPTPTPTLTPRGNTDTPSTDTPTPTPTVDGDPGTPTPTSTDGSTGATTPGFGVAAGVAGLSLAAWRYLDTRDHE